MRVSNTAKGLDDSTSRYKKLFLFYCKTAIEITLRGLSEECTHTYVMISVSGILF